jgi:hypothetical protein
MAGKSFGGSAGHRKAARAQQQRERAEKRRQRRLLRRQAADRAGLERHLERREATIREMDHEP